MVSWTTPVDANDRLVPPAGCPAVSLPLSHLDGGAAGQTFLWAALGDKTTISCVLEKLINLLILENKRRNSKFGFFQQTNAIDQGIKMPVFH